MHDAHCRLYMIYISSPWHDSDTYILNVFHEHSLVRPKRDTARMTTKVNVDPLEIVRHLVSDHTAFATNSVVPGWIPENINALQGKRVNDRLEGWVVREQDQT